MPTLSQLLCDFDPARGLHLPPQWLQGRTAYGGITTASAVAAAQQLADGPLPPLRSAQVSFIGPALGALRCQVQTLRAGKSVTSVGVDVLGEQGLAARLMLVFGQARQSTLAHDFSERPGVRGPESYAELGVADSPALAAAVPAFMGNFQLRPAAGSMPVSGADNPEIVAWVRHRDAEGVDPCVALIALADALPPAAFTSYRQLAPISSINWSFDLLGPVPAGEWFLLRSASDYTADGYSSQQMQVWDIDGRLLMRGRQAVAVFV